MWALVSPSWWWVMAAWLRNKSDFCVHMANAIEEAQVPQDPAPGEPGYVPRAAATAEALDERYGLTEKGWQEDDPESDPDEPWVSVSPTPPSYRSELESKGVYMTHNVVRRPSDDGLSVKVTGWCTGCDPSNCCGCCHIEDVVDE